MDNKWHDKSIIWLQDGEEEGQADCGCRLINDEDGARFIMCRKHGAAKGLLEALEGLLKADVYFPPNGHKSHAETTAAVNKARAAVARARNGGEKGRAEV